MKTFLNLNFRKERASFLILARILQKNLLMTEPFIFPSNSSRAGKALAEACQRPFCIADRTCFSDTEIQVAPPNIDLERAILFHSLAPGEGQSVNDKLFELYFLACALKDRGCGRLRAVLPYLPYARADKIQKTHDQLGLKHVANILESSGIEEFFFLDVHNIAATQNAFKKKVVHLEAEELFVNYIMENLSGHVHNGVAIVSPDLGGIKRAAKLRNSLQKRTDKEIDLAFFEKRRSQTGVSIGRIYGNIEGKTIFIVDDMISTGNTLVKALEGCQHAGALQAWIFAAHALFTGAADAITGHKLTKRVVVTDSVPFLKDRFELSEKLDVLSWTPVFANRLCQTAPPF